MSTSPPGTPLIQGEGPEQIQQANPLANYFASTLATMVPNTTMPNHVLAQDIQHIPQAVNELAIATAPVGVARPYNPALAFTVLDGSAPS